MNKIFLIGLAVLICLSCKQNKSNSTDANEAVAPKESKADIGGLYQYYHSNPTTLEQREENILIEYAADKNMDAIRTRSGVYITTHVQGKGDSIKWGDPIKVHYKGYFLNGKEFDSSYKRGAPIEFRVGSMNAGWNESFPFLTKGSKATFLLPSHMGYGKKGFPGYIGPDEIIAFDVEIFDEPNQ